MSACAGNATRSVQALLDAGTLITREDSVQDQAIHHARTIEILKMLVEKGADVNQLSGSGDWPLKDAAGDNDVERGEWLLNHGALVDLTSTGETALHGAVRWDSREIARLLLKRGADPNAQDVDGWTPLFGANSREMIQLLLQSGADPAIEDQAGDTAKKWLSDPLLLELV